MYNEIKYIDIDTKELIFQESGEIDPPSPGGTIVLKNSVWKVEKFSVVANHYECHLKKV